MELLKASHDKLRQALLEEKSRGLQGITSGGAAPEADLELGKASDVVRQH